MAYWHQQAPKTGHPVQHSILSSTVIANECMIADAFATSFMVMGLERAKDLLAKNKNIEAYFIYSDENGNYQTFMTEGMKKYVTE